MQSQRYYGPPPPRASSARPLLPASRAQTAQNGPGPNGSSRVVPPKKSHSTAACETCRKRKVKCNAARPACGFCTSSSITCVYTTSSADETRAQALKRKLSETNHRESTFRQIFDHLRERPEKEAGEIVKRIRDGTEPEVILRHIREGDLLLQLALVPDTRHRYAFPLTQEMPTYLLRPDNPYLSSQLFEWMTADTVPASRGQLVLSNRARRAEPRSTYHKPYHAAELVDPLLNMVKPSEWTAVSSDDVLMRKMLANYFLHDYQWFPPFQKDYFLQDMAAGRHSCCSSLLVNMVLTVGSLTTKELTNRYEYWNPRNASYQFLAEAKRLWDIEVTNSRVRLTTIQAAILLDLINFVNAMDAVGFLYTQKAVDMAQRIGLFGPAGSRLDTRRNNARAFTSWALFSWQSMLSMFHLEPALVMTPPATPLPDPSADPDWYGQFWLRYPLDPMLYTTYFPQQFKAQAGFAGLIIEGWLIMARGGVNINTSVQLPLVVEHYQTHMRKWYRTLPEPLTPSRITLPSQLMLHIYYHNMVHGLFEPISPPHHGPVTLGIGPHPDSEDDGRGETTTQIRDRSFRHFETLLRLYYLRHGFDHGNFYLGRFLAHLGFMTIRRMNALAGSPPPPSPAATPTPSVTTSSTSTTDSATLTTATPPPDHDLTVLRSTLLLAAKGLHDQGQSYFVHKAVLRTMVAQMPPTEQALLAQMIGGRHATGSVTASNATGNNAPGVVIVEDPQVLAQMRHIRSKMAPSAVTFGDKPEMHRLENLMKKLTVEEEAGRKGDGRGRVVEEDEEEGEEGWS